MEEKIKDSEVKKSFKEEVKKTTMSDEQPEFKQEFYGEWVTNPKYEIYSPTEFYLLLRNKAKDRPSLNLSEYKEWGGYWLVEFTDGEITGFWRYENHREAYYWKRQKEQTNGK